MAADAKHIPILCIDVQGFTTHNTEIRRTIVRRLQRMATEAARFFMPYGDPWTKWQRHGIGDGYYFPFDALSPQVALQYALNLEAAVVTHNAQHGQDLVLRLYGALVLGDVELVGDQYLSSAFSEAARFLSHQPFKDSLQRQDRPMLLAMSSLFHTEWRDDIERENIFPEAAALQWTPFRFRDKHGNEHRVKTRQDRAGKAPARRSAISKRCWRRLQSKQWWCWVRQGRGRVRCSGILSWTVPTLRSQNRVEMTSTRRP